MQPQGPCWHRGAHAVTYWIPDSTLRISAPTWLLSWQYVSIYVIILWLNDVPRRGVHNYYICACKYVKYLRAIILYVSVPYLKHVRTLSTNNPKVKCNDQKAKVTSRLMSSDETVLLATNPSSKESTFGHLEQHPRNLLPIDPLFSEHFQSTAKNMKKRSTAQFSDQSLCFYVFSTSKSKFLPPFHLMGTAQTREATMQNMSKHHGHTFRRDLFRIAWFQCILVRTHRYIYIYMYILTYYWTA